MENGALLIENYAFPHHPKSNAPDEQDRKAEDLHFGARDTLNDIVTGIIPAHFIESGIVSRQAWLMRVLKPIAKFYGVNDTELLDVWLAHYGTGRMDVVFGLPAGDAQ